MTSTLPESHPEIYSHAGAHGGILKHVPEHVYRAMGEYAPTAKKEDGTFKLVNPRGDGVAGPDISSPPPNADQYAS